MKSLISGLILASLLIGSPVNSQPKGRCFDIPEEVTSSTTIVRKFPKFNIQIEVSENSNSVLLANGDILIVDRGTYKYLQCLQNNPKALGRVVTGYLISKGKKGTFNRMLTYGNDKFIIYNNNYSYMALRLLYEGQTTDVTVFGIYLGEEKENIQLLKDIAIITDVLIR